MFFKTLPSPSKSSSLLVYDFLDFSTLLVYSSYKLVMYYIVTTIPLQGPPLGIDIMYLVLADRNMQVRFGLKVVW